MMSPFKFKSEKVACKIPYLAGLWSALKVLGHVAISPSLLICTAFLTPLLWALLPLGYEILNANESIKTHSVITVFVRMVLSFGFSLVVFLITILISRLRSPGLLMDVWKSLKGSPKKWLCLLLFPIFYSLARLVEMKLILGGGYEKPVEAYGYFMGLLLVVLFPMIRNKNPIKDITIIEMLLWLCTVCIVLASGILNVVARMGSGTATVIWNQIGKALLMALIVALFSWSYVMFKQVGKIDCQDDSHPYLIPFLSASIMNVVMCLGAAICSGVAIKVFHKDILNWEKLFEICNLYFDKDPIDGFLYSRLFWIGVIVLLATVVAPMAQLYGVSRHDIVMKNRHMDRFGVSGGDWLIVCGGFEPMFVVLLGCGLSVVFSWFNAGAKLEKFNLSNLETWPIVLCFALVISIALMRIVKIWGERNAMLRNVIFTRKRGSTHADLSTKTSEELQIRAEELALLKLYHKRKELANVKLGVSGVSDIKNIDCDKESDLWAQISSDKNCRNYIVVEGADKYFTQDDPFTNDVLEAQFAWLKKECPNIEIMSFSRYLSKRGKKDNKEAWRKFKKNTCRGFESATPFFLFENKGGGDELKKVQVLWDSFLRELKDIVDKGEVSQYVNKMILTFKDVSNE
ncbi:MAG: hypothetical protein E7046_00505 [Lentisphaerae bacterium]|nr:hypothetical protein [Lentisphaerota bacterium]